MSQDVNHFIFGKKKEAGHNKNMSSDENRMYHKKN